MKKMKKLVLSIAFVIIGITMNAQQAELYEMRVTKYPAPTSKGCSTIQMVNRGREFYTTFTENVKIFTVDLETVYKTKKTITKPRYEIKHIGNGMFTVYMNNGKSLKLNSSQMQDFLYQLKNA